MVTPHMPRDIQPIVASFIIVIISLPVLENQELATVVTHDLLPYILDAVEHRVIEGEVH